MSVCKRFFDLLFVVRNEAFIYKKKKKKKTTNGKKRKERKKTKKKKKKKKGNQSAGMIISISEHQLLHGVGFLIFD